MSDFFEPWRVEEPRPGVVLVVDCERRTTCDFLHTKMLSAFDREYARRIVACVNAMRGIPTEHVEKMMPERWLPLVREVMAEAKPNPALQADVFVNMIPGDDGEVLEFEPCGESV